MTLRINSMTDDPFRFESMRMYWSLHSFEYTNNNYHPMNLLPSIASPVASNIADLLSKPISRHRFDTLIGDIRSPAPSTSVATATVDPSALVAPTVDSSAATTTVVASAPTVPSATSDSVDTGASLPVAPSYSDFALDFGQAPYELIRTPTLVVSDSKAYSAFQASTPVDPYTLITGEDTATVDLSFLDSDSVDTVEFASTLVYSSFRQFGTATLVFLTDANSKLISILVEPTQLDWLHWVPLPRLTPTESYFHIFGLDYLQAFTLFHLISIWTYCLLHFVVPLED